MMYSDAFCTLHPFILPGRATKFSTPEVTNLRALKMTGGPVLPMQSRNRSRKQPKATWRIGLPNSESECS